MKILLTGATGFLGKEVMRRFVDNALIKKITVISRSKKTYPSSKVKILSLDISIANSMNALEEVFPVDAVVHLAGLYDFNRTYSKNYIENIVAATGLVVKLKEWNKKHHIPVFYASTYAVGFENARSEPEEPLAELPPKSIPYAYSKAIADRIFTDSGLSGAVMRFGVLIGDSKHGWIEKLDGPYYFLKLMHEISQKFWLKKAFKGFPIPASPSVIIPIVPVDIAADACVQIVMKALTETKNNKNMNCKVYGVYRPDTVSVGELSEKILSTFMTESKPIYIEKSSKYLLQAQKLITKIPPALFEFSTRGTKLSNEQFVRDFPQFHFPEFSEISEAFIQGYLQMFGSGQR